MNAECFCAHPVLGEENRRSIIDGESWLLAVTGPLAVRPPRFLWFTESLRGGLNRFRVMQNASMGELPTKLFSEN